MKRTVMLVLGCILALGLFSCGSDDTDDDDFISILVNDAETVSAAETGQLLILRLSNGVSATWSVSNTSVATLSATSGVSVCLIAQAAGNVTVTATAGGKTYTCALQITAKDNAPNVSFTNLSAYKVVVCRDGLSAEIATVEAGATKSVYVAPGTNEITFHFRYAYCIIADDDSGTVWLDVADNGAYTYPVDSADIAQGAVQISIPAPKNPQFNAAYLKVENQSTQPISLYNGNTQQKLYGQEKYYIQPGHSGVYGIPPDAPFESFLLGASPSSATAVESFYAVSGTLYACGFAEAGSPVDVREEMRLGEMWADKTYIVTFEANGGTASYPIETSLLEELDMPKPTRQGYSFVGWYTDGELQHTIVYPYMVTADITLYAKWAGNDTTYTVRHFKQNIDCTSYTLIKTETLTGTTGATSAAVATTHIGFTADLFDQMPISADGKTVIDIFYDRNEYTVTFNANGGTGDTQTQTFYYGIAEKLKDTMFSYPGYTFLGWASSKTGNPVYANKADFLIDAQNPTDITLYAVWLHGVTVTADTAGSIDLSDITDEYTVKVVGNISQSTLQTLADKIKTAKVSINLDLSEATRLIAIGSASDSTSSNSTSIFAGCPLNSVALPETLEVIGSYAFAKCSIKSVTIPASVQTIGNYAFSYCSNLEVAEIDGAETVGGDAFYHCTSLKTVVLKNIKTIGSYAFYGCESLLSVTMESVGSIGSSAFSVSSSSYYPASSNLESVEIDGAETVGYNAFYNCKSLKTIALKNVNTIDKNAFKNCTNLSSVTMEAIGAIDGCAFQDCTSLSSIAIDAESIGTCVFSGCTSLTAVVIGKNVKSIDNTDDGCFKDCSQLTSVRFEDTEGWYYKYSSSSHSYKKDVTNAANNVSSFKYNNYLWFKE